MFELTKKEHWYVSTTKRVHLYVPSKSTTRALTPEITGGKVLQPVPRRSMTIVTFQVPSLIKYV